MSRSVRGSQPQKRESGRLVRVSKFDRKLKVRKQRRDWNRKGQNEHDDRV